MFRDDNKQDPIKTDPRRQVICIHLAQTILKPAPTVLLAIIIVFRPHYQTVQRDLPFLPHLLASQL